MIGYEKVISKLYNTELVKDWFIKMSYWTQCLVHFFMNQFLSEKSYLTKHCLTIRDSVVTKTAHPGLILMSESSNIIETMPAWIALWMLNIWWAITDNTYMRSNNKIRFFFKYFGLPTYITDNIISLPVYQFCGIHQNMTKLHKMPSLWEIWQRHCNGHSQNN